MPHGYSYQDTLATAARINWNIEDIIGDDKRLDFSCRFLPESLARVDRLSFLDPDEKRVLNQIRGNAYLCIFGLVEEFILPFVIDHARPGLDADDYRTRALLTSRPASAPVATSSARPRRSRRRCWPIRRSRSP